MLPIRIGLVSKSASVAFEEVVRAASAINLQVTRDLYAIWNITATVSALPDPAAVPLGIWPVFIVDDVGVDGAAGLHLTDHQQPYALVETGDTWTLTASHECLEMLVDPSGNRLVSSAGIGVQGGAVVDLPDQKFEYLVEVADPSEDQASAYMVDDVLVSDFYTPNFYDPSPSQGVRYSFSGKITAPRQVLPGGYLSWYNSVLGHMQQLRWQGVPAIVDIPGSPNASTRRTLRGFVDSHAGGRRALSRTPVSAPEVKRQSSRSGWLSHAAALRSAAYALPSHEEEVRPLSKPDAAQRVLDAHLADLKAARGTKAYVGWQFQNGRITRNRAIVVLAAAVDVPAVRDRLPDTLEGIPVEVRPDPRPQLPGPPDARLFASAEPGTVREEWATPSFPNERSLLDPGEETNPAVLAASRKPAKPSVQYQPPADVSLAAKEFDVTLTLHISPEQGWAQLKPFLAATESKLTVGIYEFTAPHIDAAFTSDLRAPKELVMTMDSPPEQKGKREQTVVTTETDLSGSIGRRMDFAWALSGMGTQAVGKAFPTSYHIKVAVRDGKVFWLSSGNFNSSNQPDIDPTDEAALSAAFSSHDRDWHVICECPELAAIYEKFLLNDYKQASEAASGVGAQAALMAAAPHAALAPPGEVLAAAPRKPRQFFAPQVVKGKMKIKPLLTPDDYRAPILELIKSAKSRFYMQTQYIHTVDAGKDAGNPSHMDLINAVIDKIKAGVDVRLIITSEFQKPWVEKLQDAGIDSSHLRLQENVHNKGMVVDSSIVVVSSQNWSDDGTGLNRDAGLIIYNSDAAAYFEQIFLHDWVNLARPA